MPTNRKEIIITQFGESAHIEDLIREYLTLIAKVKKIPYNDPEYLIIQRRLFILKPLLKHFPRQL